jgi:3',5'-cyclic AMP phosphodiesterase CpdA
VFVLAHLSDLHATPVRLQSVREILNKRALGCSPGRCGGAEHRAAVLDALVDDLAQLAPDHIAVTGDLTNLGLASEFEAALGWLARLGGPSRVSVVPGNHDSYVASPQAAGWAPWPPAWRAGERRRERAEAGAAVGSRACACRGQSPWLGSVGTRQRAFLATGRLGRDQRSGWPRCASSRTWDCVAWC